MSNSYDITPIELKKRLDDGDQLTILDVREPFEYQICHLPSSTLIPMAQLSQKLSLLEREREIVVVCHAGIRSRMAASWLRQMGFRVLNLSGGIDEWARTVDPCMPRY